MGKQIMARNHRGGGKRLKKAQVQIGSTYIVKVSGVLAKVRITAESPYGGWRGMNLASGREVRIRSAARLRRPAQEQ